MACRIGITTNPEERKKYWKGRYPNLKWKILESNLTKQAAQKRENELAQQYNCKAYAGGENKADASWYVYRFDH